MTTLIDKGWLVLTNGADVMKLAVRSITAERRTKTKFTHYVGGNFSIDLGLSYHVWNCSGLIFDSVANMETFLAYTQTWQQTAAFTMYVYKDGSSNKIKWNGTDTDYTVRIAENGTKGIHLADGGTGYAFIDTLILEEG